MQLRGNPRNEYPYLASIESPPRCRHLQRAGTLLAMVLNIYDVPARARATGEAYFEDDAANAKWRPVGRDAGGPGSCAAPLGALHLVGWSQGTGGSWP